MNILITGASGFVGSALSKHLVSLNHKLTLTQRKQSRTGKNTDLTIYINNKDIYKHIGECDIVIHLAARTHVMHETLENPYLAYMEVNVNQTVELAKQAIDAGIKRFIFMSSVKVIGETSDMKALTEEDICLPEDNYGKSKLEAEVALKAIFTGTDIELVIIRPPLIYGAGVKANFKNLISICNKPIPLPFGAIKNKRSLIYLENLIDFIETCCRHPSAANHVFLISDDEDVSTTKLIKSIKNALNKPMLLLSIPHNWLVTLLKILGKNNLANRLCGNLQLDINKAKTLLGWHPTFTFEQGIRKTVEAYQQNDKKNN
jgi:nucleoside-diphosphate-sugar epimerase